jgi:Domain of unknown function (DUF5710)
VGRIYLNVPSEEAGQVEALGAQWDKRSECWCIDTRDGAQFRPWLPPEEADDAEEMYAVVSDNARIISASVICWSCQSSIEVIGIYCASGLIEGEVCTHFSVSHITAMDGALEKQLQEWPHFRKSFTFNEEPQGDCFCNHCPYCAAPQEEFHLHWAQDGPFFRLTDAGPKTLRMIPLEGIVRLTADETTEL